MTDLVDDMPDIPAPQWLDPQRVDRDDRANMTLEDHRSRSQLLGRALDESCGYASQLWQTLAAARIYLHENTPADLDDDRAWASWQDAYAGVVSALSGPHGDSGFGSGQAQLIAQHRRASR